MLNDGGVFVELFYISCKILYATTETFLKEKKKEKNNL